NSVDEGIVGKTDKPYCELDYADYELDADLVGFEMRDKFGLDVGFKPGAGPLSRIGVGFQSESGKMSINMKLNDSLQPLENLTDVMGEGTFTKLNFSIGFDLLMGIGLGTSIYTETPVGKLSGKTMVDSYKKTKKELDAFATEWNTKVVRIISPTEFIIPAGAIAGLRVGDQVKLFNLDIEWEGTACRSGVVFQRETTTLPIAKAQVVQLENKAALIRVYESAGDADLVELGARVKVEKLPLAKGEKSRVLKRGVRVRNITSRELELEGGK
ncbi:MAG: hypothetical protein AABZ31_05230, partial [Bdellovibrionota bacterium]